MDFKKKIIISSIIIFAAIVIALICFLIYPLVKGIKKNSEEFISLRKKIILSQGEIGKIEQFKGTYKTLQPNLEKIDKILVDPEIPLDLIKFFEKTAYDSGLSVDISLVTPRTAETDPWESLGFQLSLTGTFPNFSRFLDKIETGPYLIEVQSLAAKKPSVSPGGVNVSLVTKIFTKPR